MVRSNIFNKQNVGVSASLDF